MSAVKEWFYLYDIIFSFIKDSYGKETLEQYLQYLADAANSDISDRFRNGGTEAAAGYYRCNFEKDGAAVEMRREGETVTLEIGQCPAFSYMKGKGVVPASDYCGCCRALNSRICLNAGISLKITPEEGGGKCLWQFKRL